MRHIRCFSVILLLILCGLLTCAQAEEATVIRTAEELAAMERDGNYVLGNDINLSGVEWRAFGFGGSLDGQGHTITGLRVTSSDMENYGLFSWISGTVSNLNVKDAVIDISTVDANCFATIIGMCDSTWSFDPSSSNAHIFNCNVSGTITVRSSGNGKIGGIALASAQESTADVDIELEGRSIMSPALFGCRDSVFKGDITVSSLTDSTGIVSAILNSSGCEATGNITVNSVEAKEYGVGAWGIYGWSEKRCSNCKFTGDIANTSYTSVIECGDFCEADGTFRSDNLFSLEDCTNSTLTGELSAVGELYISRVWNIRDWEDKEEPCNVSYANVNIPSIDAVTYLNVMNVLGKGSVLHGDVNVNVGTTNVSLEETPCYIQDDEYFPYNHGSVTITTTTGDIYLNRQLATVGEVILTSGNAWVTGTVGRYNTGNITVNTTDHADITGGQIYNSGTISVNCRYGIAKGTSWPDSLNEGSVTVTSSVGGNVSAMGATGTSGACNTASVTANSSSSHNGQYAYASAVGIDSPGGLNTGAVVANSTGAADACGAVGEGAFNTADITANGGGERLTHAFGTKNGASSTGTVRATGTGVSNADGDGGSAYAYGDNANATGVDPHATCSDGGPSLSGTQYLWLLYDHRDCTCNPPFSIVFGSPTNPSDDHHYYHQRASTQRISFSGGTQPEVPEVIMPDEMGQKPGKVEIDLFRDMSSSYPVSQFTYTLGSFSFDNADRENYSYLYARIMITNDSEETQDYELTIELPEGLSFREWELQETMDISCSLESMATDIQWIPVYPIYREEYTSGLTFAASGDLVNAVSYPVLLNDKSGIIYSRPTQNVNMSSSAIEVQVSLDPVEDLIKADPDSYNDHLALITCALSQAIYEKDYLYHSLDNLGFTQIAWYNASDIHDVASCYAVKKVIQDGTVKPVVLAVVRGTMGLEWVGNLNVGYLSPMHHKDFEQAANRTQSRYQGYLDAQAIPVQNGKVIFAAHSRAAAATNIVCHKLISSGSSSADRLTAYCYATPSSTRKPVAYSNIFNILYIDDLVGYVAPGYFKYGNTYVVGSPDTGNSSSDAPAEVAAAFEKYCGKPYMNPRSPRAIAATVWAGHSVSNIATDYQWLLGLPLSLLTGDTGISQAHGAENYLAWTEGAGISGSMSFEEACLSFYDREKLTMTSLHTRISDGLAISGSDETLSDAAQVMGVYAYAQSGLDGAEFVRVSCPVEVSVLDADGHVLMDTVDHQLQGENADGMVAIGTGNTSLFGMPAGDSYTLKITGVGEGVMQIHLTGIDDDYSSTGSASCIDVPVTTGEEFRLQLRSDADRSEWIMISSRGSMYFPGGDASVIYLPDSTEILDSQAFMGNSSMKGVLVCPEGMTTLGSDVFSGTGLTGIFIPDSVRNIDSAALNGCTATIYCYEGSDIQRFAAAQGLNVVALNPIN